MNRQLSPSSPVVADLPPQAAAQPSSIDTYNQLYRTPSPPPVPGYHHHRRTMDNNDNDLHQQPQEQLPNTNPTTLGSFWAKQRANSKAALLDGTAPFQQHNSSRLSGPSIGSGAPMNAPRMPLGRASPSSTMRSSHAQQQQPLDVSARALTSTPTSGTRGGYPNSTVTLSPPNVSLLTHSPSPPLMTPPPAHHRPQQHNKPTADNAAQLPPLSRGRSANDELRNLLHRYEYAESAGDSSSDEGAEKDDAGSLPVHSPASTYQEERSSSPPVITSGNGNHQPSSNVANGGGGGILVRSPLLHENNSSVGPGGGRPSSAGYSPSANRPTFHPPLNEWAADDKGQTKKRTKSKSQLLEKQKRANNNEEELQALHSGEIAAITGDHIDGVPSTGLALSKGSDSGSVGTGELPTSNASDMQPLSLSFLQRNTEHHQHYSFHPPLPLSHRAVVGGGVGSDFANSSSIRHDELQQYGVGGGGGTVVPALSGLSEHSPNYANNHRYSSFAASANSPNSRSAAFSRSSEFAGGGDQQQASYSPGTLSPFTGNMARSSSSAMGGVAAVPTLGGSIMRHTPSSLTATPSRHSTIAALMRNESSLQRAYSVLSTAPSIRSAHASDGDELQAIHSDVLVPTTSLASAETDTNDLQEEAEKARANNLINASAQTTETIKAVVDAATEIAETFEIPQTTVPPTTMVDVLTSTKDLVVAQEASTQIAKCKQQDQSIQTEDDTQVRHPSPFENAPGAYRDATISFPVAPEWYPGMGLNALLSAAGIHYQFNSSDALSLPSSPQQHMADASFDEMRVNPLAPPLEPQRSNIKSVGVPVSSNQCGDSWSSSIHALMSTVGEQHNTAQYTEGVSQQSPLRPIFAVPSTQPQDCPFDSQPPHPISDGDAFPADSPPPSLFSPVAISVAPIRGAAPSANSPQPDASLSPNVAPVAFREKGGTGKSKSTLANHTPLIIDGVSDMLMTSICSGDGCGGSSSRIPIPRFDTAPADLSELDENSVNATRESSPKHRPTPTTTNPDQPVRMPSGILQHKGSYSGSGNINTSSDSQLQLGYNHNAQKRNNSSTINMWGSDSTSTLDFEANSLPFLRMLMR